MIINSVEIAKEEALKLIAKNVDGVIFSYGVFSFPNFSEVAAKNLNVPLILAANLNPAWPEMVGMIASGGAHVNFLTKAGNATIARLNKFNDEYRLTVIPTEFIEIPKEKMSETTREWPHVFAKLPFDYRIFLYKFEKLKTP